MTNYSGHHAPAVTTPLNDGTGASHGTFKSYFIGFVLSIILTIIPYYLVVNHVLMPDMLYVLVLVLAVGQLIIQVVFFLHLSVESKPRWNLIAFIFTLLVVCILVIGSIWIMHNLNVNMMLK